MRLRIFAVIFALTAAAAVSIVFAQSGPEEPNPEGPLAVAPTPEPDDGILHPRAVFIELTSNCYLGWGLIDFGKRGVLPRRRDLPFHTADLEFLVDGAAVDGFLIGGDVNLAARWYAPRPVRSYGPDSGYLPYQPDTLRLKAGPTFAYYFHAWPYLYPFVRLDVSGTWEQGLGSIHGLGGCALTPRVGAAYFLGRKIGFELQFYYDFGGRGDASRITGHEFGAKVGFVFPL